MTTEPDRMSDEQLLRDLRRVLDSADPREALSSEAAKAAFDWVRIDAELADVIFDSAVDRPDVMVRSSSSALRQMTFQATAAEVTIEVEIGDSMLIGQIIPPQAAEIFVARVGGTTLEVAADESGVFQVRELEPGPTTLTARAANGSWSVRCSWTVS